MSYPEIAFANLSSLYCLKSAKQLFLQAILHLENPRTNAYILAWRHNHVSIPTVKWMKMPSHNDRNDGNLKKNQEDEIWSDDIDLYYGGKD